MAECSDEWAKLLKYNDVSVRRTAAQALGTLGPAASPAASALIEALRDKIGYVRMAAAEALGHIGAQGAVPTLLELLQDNNAGVRYEAAEALRKLGQEVPPMDGIARGR